MRFRIAKKVFRSQRWLMRTIELRPPYMDEQGRIVYPSCHNIGDPTIKKARTILFRKARKGGEE